MSRTGRKSKRVGIFLLLFAMLVTGFGTLGYNKASALVEKKYDTDSLVRTSLDEIEDVLTSVSYNSYLSMYKNISQNEAPIEIDVADYDKDNTTATVKETTVGELPITETYSDTGTTVNKDEKVLLTGDDGKISWLVNIPKDAMYNIYIEYYTGDIEIRTADGEVISGKSSTAERYLFIDGKVPFKEARSIELSKEWADSYKVIAEDGSTSKLLSSDEEFVDYALNPENLKTDSDRLYAADGNGNEIKPDKQILNRWAGTYLTDSTGYYNEPLKFCFTAGEHVISLQTIREPLAVKKVTLCMASTAPTYEEYLASVKSSGISDYTGESIVIQAEYAVETSERTIYQLNDRSSLYTEPQDASQIRLNYIGGDKWQYVGQWVEWVVDVPEDGLYNIIPRSKQSIYAGTYVSRAIYINGELPFKEAGFLRFDYSSDWQTDPLNDGTTDFLFKLNKGRNVIRMEAVLGDMSQILNTVESSLQIINGYYRKILMITGPDADTFRDYGFKKLIPDVLKGLRQESELLYGVSAMLTELTGEKGEHSSSLDRVALTCERMGYYPSTIAGSMSSLKDYTASLGTWLTDTQNQPLSIDYISFQAPAAEAPAAEPGFFGTLWGEIVKFFMSFFTDYNSIGSTLGTELTDEDIKETSIVVWTVTSRDQAQIIRSLVDDDFTAKYNIPVTVKLVAGGTLLPATLAGTGPDVYMGAAQGDPVNYAIRSAVKSLNTTTGNTEIGYNFNDLKNSIWYTATKEDGSPKYEIYRNLIDRGLITEFDEIKTWFADTAMVPLTLYGETYGIPETMSFSMMFYRKDIFVELGVEVPDTWEEFYDIIYTLQSNVLDIGFPTGIGGSQLLMYQQNESLYDMGNYDYYLDLMRSQYTDEELNELGYTYTDSEGNTIPKTDGISINLDSDVALASFQEVCNFFTMYDFPISYNFANRFRSGEMPLAVIDYTSYNTLIVFAPEINGLWEFTPLPGIMQEDDTVNNTTLGAVSAMIMMRSVNESNALAAWSFMQWWMGEDIQSAYGNEMIALLGPSAKQATANMNALQDMSWSKDEHDNLFAQFNAVQCNPEFPGSYIIGRYANFAFLDVVNNSAEPIQEMQSQITDINNELTRKRTEFHLPTADTIKDLKQKQEEGVS